jgi:hypothetical protein
MHQLLSRRRLGIFIALIATFILLAHVFRPESLYPTISEKHDALGDVDDLNPDDLFYNVDQIAGLESSEPPLHQHSVKWADKDGIPETRVLAHVPGRSRV